VSLQTLLLLLLLLLLLQVTVNNQIVIGTLMNICDDPNHVSIGAGWREGDHIRRVPIIVTGGCPHWEYLGSCMLTKAVLLGGHTTIT
jgi:hypothetical protein